ncbi:MAG: hypothetical protein ACREBO_05280 [Novosphingobium sp.]
MKHYALLAGIALLAACSQKPAEEPAAIDTAAATEAAAAPTPTAGTYEVTNPDGTTGTTVLNADGTYVDTDAAGKEVKGAWVVKDGKTCFTPEGQAEECYTESARAADGSFTASDAKGGTVQVKPKA